MISSRSVFVLVSIFFCFIFLASAQEERSILVTKGEKCFYAGGCQKEVFSNDMNIPIEVVKEAIEKDGRDYASTEYKYPSGMFGQWLKSKTVIYDKVNFCFVQKSLDKKTNFPAWIIFFLSFIFLTLMFLYKTRLIDEKNFIKTYYHIIFAIFFSALFLAEFRWLNIAQAMADWMFVAALIIIVFSAILLANMANNLREKITRKNISSFLKKHDKKNISLIEIKAGVEEIACFKDCIKLLKTKDRYVARKVFNYCGLILFFLLIGSFIFAGINGILGFLAFSSLITICYTTTLLLTWLNKKKKK